MLNTNFGNIVILDNNLICYSDKSLPFESHTEDVKYYKENIKECLSKLQISDGQVLVAEYYAPNDEYSDIENKLFYNISMSSFEKLICNGVLFRRTSPEEIKSIVNQISKEIDDLNDCYINIYRIMSKEDAKIVFKKHSKNMVAETIATLDLQFNEETAQDYYQALRNCKDRIRVKEQLNKETKYSLYIEVGTYSQKKKFHNIIKPMVDGLICGCHEEDNVDTIKKLLKDKANTDLVQMDKYPLWKKNYIRDQVNKWNPADDYLECAFIVPNSVVIKFGISFSIYY